MGPTAEADWQGLSPYPELSDTEFWAPDHPRQSAPLAFGKLPAEFPVHVRLPSVRSYRLSVDLPHAPAQLPVFLAGRYPDDYKKRFQQLIGDQPGWSFVPAYSLLFFSGKHEGFPPQGEIVPTQTREQAIQRATQLLRPFVWPDRDIPEAEEFDGGWRVFFRQQVDGIRIDQDKPLQAEISRDGQLTYALGRRRPLLNVSSYPVRTARDAWNLVASGKGFGFTLLNHRPIPAALSEFTVTQVALRYVQTHANTDLEVMQPYWAFENELGSTVFIPAVRDPDVTWPVAGQ